MNKKKILIVDDEEKFTKYVKLNLESTGKYEVRVENKGSHGLEAAKAFKPDLILLDVMMPDMDGSEVAAQLKEEESCKNIPVVFLTAIITEQEIDEKGSDIGGHPFIAKPINLKNLISGIEQNMGNNSK
ncbi:MAG: response regulator [Sedimentisphaerales bacterium]|jgi:CheY-like chemotaxis protein